VNHGGARKVFDWGRAISRQEPSRIHWAAFFGDVDHSIEEVRWGWRITLTYVLRRGGGASRAPAPRGSIAARFEAALDEAMRDRRFFARGVTLAFPCFHMYSRQAAFQKPRRGRLTEESIQKLKGRDHDVAAAGLHARLPVTLEPYLIETCADERWRLEQFPPAESRGLLGDQVTESDLEDALSISARSEEDEDLGVTWVLPPPGADTPLKPRADRVEAEAGEPCSEHFHSCEYSPTGYFGNEGSETDFYLYAALHVTIPAWGKGPRKAAGASGKTSGGKRKRSKRKTRALGRSASPRSGPSSTRS
jgi:hypothetical protein